MTFWVLEEANVDIDTVEMAALKGSHFRAAVAVKRTCSLKDLSTNLEFCIGKGITCAFERAIRIIIISDISDTMLLPPFLMLLPQVQEM